MKRLICLLLITAVGGAVMFGLSGCFSKKYKVDYCGQKDSFADAKDYYKPGTKVELKFLYIATDTDYTFYLDDQIINPEYYSTGGGCFIISFIMPEHDVKLRWNSRNTMDNNTVTESPLLVDYYHAVVATAGGDRHYELVLSEAMNYNIRLDVYRGTPGSEETKDSYIVPRESVDKCMEVIRKNKINEWNDRTDTYGITGAVTVVKYRDDYGNYVRVSTEKMPENGERIMDEVKTVMEQYIKPEYKIDD